MTRFVRWARADIGPKEKSMALAVLEAGEIGAKSFTIKLFEAQFASAVGARYALAVSNGTCALLLALEAIKHRVERRAARPVIGVPTFTFIASANMALRTYSSVDLIDCDRKTWNIRRDLVPPGLDVLMAVDVGGLPCDYDALREIGLPIIADSAESIGARYKGRPVGSQADVHCFSLHSAKVITTGEGGMVTTNDKELYELMESLANHGYDPAREPWEYRHERSAYNFRMTGLQAAVGLAQLEKLGWYTDGRRRKAGVYKDFLGGLVEYQEEPPDRRHAHFFFGILVEAERRDSFCADMFGEGIEVKTWTPVHRQKMYRYRGDLPNASEVSDRIVLLPIHNKLSDDDLVYVAGTARRLLR